MNFNNWNYNKIKKYKHFNLKLTKFLVKSWKINSSAKMLQTDSFKMLKINNKNCKFSKKLKTKNKLKIVLFNPVSMIILHCKMIKLTLTKDKKL